MPLKLCLSDDSVPTGEDEAKVQAEEEIRLFNEYLRKLPASADFMKQDLSPYEQMIIRTYIMAKLSGQIPNPAKPQ